VTGDSGRIHQPAKKKEDDDANRDRRPDFFAEPDGFEIQRVFNRADLNTVHAAAAFRAGNTDLLIDRQQGRTDIGTSAALDTVIRVSFDLGRTNQCQNPHQCAVWTQIAAPEIFNWQGEQCQKQEHHEGKPRHFCKKEKHFYVGDLVIGSLEKLEDSPCFHGKDDPDEKTQQKIFYNSQRVVQPVGKNNAFLENFCTQFPEPFRQCTHGAKPAAERFSEKKGNQTGKPKDDHGGRMDRIPYTGSKEQLPAHERADGKKSLHTRRSMYGNGTVIKGLVDKNEKLQPDCEGQYKDAKLDPVANSPL